MTELANTSYDAFRAVVDSVIRDFKGDTQELQMIVAMMPVQDVLSLDNLALLIRGDKALYVPRPRANAKDKSKVTAPSSANQQQGALLALLPHYAELCEENDRKILTAKGVMKQEQSAVEKASKRNLTDREIVSMFKKVTVSTTARNASKSEAELKCEAIEKMFSRAIAKLYYLRRVSADNVTLDKKSKTIHFDGFDFSVTDGKAKLLSAKGQYAKTLAELGRDATTWLKTDGVNSARGKSGTTDKKVTAPTAPTTTVELSPLNTAADNSKALNSVITKLVKSKDKAQVASFKKAEYPKALLSSLIRAIYVNDGVLDVQGLQSAITNATSKAGCKPVILHVETDISEKASKVA